jgi:hypothetical protein
VRPRGGAGQGGGGRSAPERSMVAGEGGRWRWLDGVSRPWRSPSAEEDGGEVLQLEEESREVRDNLVEEKGGTRLELTVRGGGGWQERWLKCGEERRRLSHQRGQKPFTKLPLVFLVFQQMNYNLKN